MEPLNSKQLSEASTRRWQRIYDQVMAQTGNESQARMQANKFTKGTIKRRLGKIGAVNG